MRHGTVTSLSFRLLYNFVSALNYYGIFYSPKHKLYSHWSSLSAGSTLMNSTNLV